MMFQLSNVTFRIQGEGPATAPLLYGLSALFEGPRVVAVTGPSGSGKSTLLAIAGGLLTPHDGQVRFGRSSLYDLPATALADLRLNTFGWVMQKPLLLAGVSAEENVAVPAVARGEPRDKALAKARQLLEEVGLGKKVRARSEQLSGGEAARVAVCRALVNSPSVIFADEPTAALDKHTASALGELLRRQSQMHGCLVLMVTHDEELAQVADTRLRLHDGQLHAA